MPLHTISLKGATLVDPDTLEQEKLSKLKPISLKGAILMSTPSTEFQPHIQKEPISQVTNAQAFWDGFVQDMTFEKKDLHPDDEVFARNSTAIAHVAGRFTSFGAQAIALSSVSFGVGGITLYGAKSAQLAKSAAIYTKAVNSLRKGTVSVQSARRAQRVALETAGVGTPNALLKWNASRRAILNNFMKTAAVNPAKARRYMLYQEMLRDGTINAALGQKFVTEENLGRPVTIKDRLRYGGQDLIAGGFFGAGRSWNALRGLDKLSRGENLFKGGLYFASGFSQSLPHLEGRDDLNMKERVIMGAISSVIGRVLRGGTVTKAKEDVHRALNDIGITDEKLLTQITDLSLAISTKHLPKMLDDSYSGLVLKNTKTGKNSTIKNFVIKEPKEGKGQNLYIQYLDEAGETKTQKADTFFKKHRQKDWEKIDRIKNNLDDNDKSISWFKDKKELNNFLKTKKYGIVTAEESKYVGTYGHHKFLYEKANDELIRVLLAKGYKRKDIMALKGTFGGTKENSFLVKNLKPQDAADIARQFGQESVLTQTGLIEYMRKGGSKTSLDIAEIKRANNTGKVLFGKKATEVLDEGGHKNYSTIKLQNGKSEHFAVQLDFKDYRNIPSKYIEGTMNDVLLRGIQKVYPKFKTLQERKRLISLIKQEEAAYGLDNKQLLKVKGDYLSQGNPFNNMGHISLKKALFGKTSLTQMTDDELNKYASLLVGKEDVFAKRLNSGHIDVNTPYIKELQGVTNWVNAQLPIITKYKVLAKKFGSKALGDLSSSLLNYNVKKYRLGGAYQIFRSEMKSYLRSELGWSNFSAINKIDRDLMFFIEQGKGFKQLRSAYKNDKKMLSVIDELVKMHTKWSDDIFQEMKKAGVMQFDYIKNKKTGTMELTLVPIQKQKNFVSRQITEEFAEYINKHDKHTREYLVQSILRNDKRFRGKGKWANVPDKEKNQIAEEMLGVLTEQRARYGVYGQQFARVTDLDPRIFLDKDGRIIKGIKRWDYKKGDMIGKDKVHKVMDVYDLNYGANMDRYATKAANMIAFTKEFGARGIFKFNDKNQTRVFSDVFKKKLIKIQQTVRHQDDQRKLADMLDADFKRILGGDPVDELSEALLEKGASWTASVGLSGPRSGPKNWLLGQVQLTTTFGLKPLLREYYKLFTSKQAWKDMWREGTEINAFQAASRAIETALVKEQGIQRTVQKGLTLGMQVTEMANRGVSVVVGRTIADDALKALRNPKLSFEQKAFARRMLMDVFDLADDPKSLAKAIETGQFSDAQIAKIRYQAHSTTQGLPDAIHMPTWMSGRLAKKATLFYRIAYRVTENVYQNAYKPALRGNPAGMARYLIGTTIAGTAIGSMYMTMFNIAPDKFKKAPAQFWKLFIDGEGLGVFSALGEVDRDWQQTLTPAIPSLAIRLYGGLSLIAKGRFNADTAAESEMLIKEGRKQVAEAIPIWNDIRRFLENNSYDLSFPKLGLYGRKSYQEFQNIRSQIRSYNKNIRELELDYIPGAEYSRNIMFKKIQGHLYSNTPMEMKVNDIYATIHYVAHMNTINNLNQGMSNKKAWLEAYNLVMNNLEKQKPVNLTEKKTKGREKSDYEAFTETLTQEEFAMLGELEVLHKQNYRLIKQKVKKKKYFYLQDVK